MEYTVGTYAFSKCSPYASDQSEKDFTFRSQNYEVPENISKFSKISYQRVLLLLLICIFTVRFANSKNPDQLAKYNVSWRNSYYCKSCRLVNAKRALILLMAFSVRRYIIFTINILIPNHHVIVKKGEIISRGFRTEVLVMRRNRVNIVYFLLYTFLFQNVCDINKSSFFIL